ncbi:hypothetical protein BRC61_05155 [Halobacteriales archaeon QH_10_65_19]|nr:MAG: hypothetical protein BRC61_05155 [Halobacteriales archaeon QH_10_65_19]
MTQIRAVTLSVIIVLSMVTGTLVLTPAAASEPADTAVVAESRATQTVEDTDENDPPVATFTVSPAEPLPDETVVLDAIEATDRDGEVVSYEWRVDGEVVSANPTVEYAFAEEGDHEVRLTVTDNQGGTASLTRIVTVSADRDEAEPRPISMGAGPEPDPEFTTEKPDRGFAIPFLSGSVELAEGLDPVLTDTGRERVWAVVQFRGAPTDEELDYLQSIDYRHHSVLADRTYYAGIPTDNLKDVAELESVRAVAAINPEWKRPPALADRLGETDTEIRVIVQSFVPIPDRADSLGLERVRERTYRGELTPTQIRDLGQRETVRWIEPFDEPEPSLAESVTMAGAHGSEFSVNGSDVRVGVVDTGIEHGHPHFSGVNIVDSYDKNDSDYYPEADRFGWRYNDHGTHVAGTIAGRSTVGGESLVGVAPGVTLIVARGLGENQFQRVHDNGTDIISNSWGSGDFTGRYTSNDQFTDKWARNHPQSTLVVANGNWNSSDPREQFANTPAVAKNAISVGALNDGSRVTDAMNNVAWLNNMTGPNDGRQKPDINAPGARITSAILNSTYGTKVGTSMATPHVSGVAALYEDEYPNRDPDAAEMKAAMVAAAGPVQNPNPSERAEGYGAIDAHNMLYNNSYESRQIYYQGDLRPPIPTANTHQFDVASDAEKVVVSLSWLDPPGDAATTDTLVNDVDLYAGPASDPKRYSVTDRNQSVNRLVVDNLSPSERGTGWEVTVDPHNMWIGLQGSKARQDYDGKIRVVTENPELSVDVPDRIVVEPRSSMTQSFDAKIDATGSPVHGIRAFIESDSALGDCIGSSAHDDEHLIGTLSESYRSQWSERLCFDVPDEAGTYPVTTRVNYTDESGQTATIEEQTIIEVAKPRVELEPFERNITVGETTYYKLVVGNVSGGVGTYAVNISLDRPPIGTLTDFTVSGSPTRDTVQFEPGSDSDWVTIDAGGMDTANNYVNTTIGLLEAEGANVGKSNISVDVGVLEDETGDPYSLRPQGTTSNPLTPSDGLLNVTRGNSTPVVTIPGDGDDSSIVVDTPVRFKIDVSAIVSEYDANPTAVEWDHGDGTTGSGFQTEHAFSEPGEYGVIAQVSLDDGRTVELTYTVEVRDEPSQGTVDLSLQPGEADVPPGATRAYDLVAEGTTNGVGSYDTEITIEDTDVAEIVDARAFQKSAGLFEIEIAEDGSSVSLSGLVQFDAASEITLAEIAVESADTEGETSLDLAVTEINDGDGNPYTVGGATGATLTVSEEAGPPALPGQDDPPQDIDGDSLYEDIDGNDEFTIGDVQIFFQNRDSDVVQNNPEAFNFDEREPPGISVGDVQALFQLFGSLTVSSTR